MSGHVSFFGTAGGEERFIELNVSPDFAFEPDEEFFIDISLAAPIASVTVTDSEGKGVIINDDAPPPATGTIKFIPIANAEMVEGTDLPGDPTEGTEFSFYVVYRGPVIDDGFTMTPTIEHIDTIDADFADLAAALSEIAFSGIDGESQLLTLYIAKDNLLEGNERFHVRIGNISNQTIEDAFLYQFAIIDDDYITLSVGGPAVISEGAGTATFNVTLERGVLPDGGTFGFEGGQIRVDISGGPTGHAATEGTTLTWPADYRINNPSVLYFSGNVLSQTLTVTVGLNDDNYVEAIEKFQIIPSSPTLQAQALQQYVKVVPWTVTLTDNDAAVIDLLVGVNNVPEGSGANNPFVIMFDWRGKPADTTVTPRITVSPAAVSPAYEGEYISDGLPMVQFGPGDVSTKLKEYLTTNDNEIADGDRFFDITMVGLTFGDGQITRGVTIGNAKVTLRILDND
jgi:hypothetical protein